MGAKLQKKPLPQKEMAYFLKDHGRSWGRFHRSLIKINEMRMKTVMNHSQGGGLLKMIRRTDPVILLKKLQCLVIQDG
jgi:hypothetical protein